MEIGRKLTESKLVNLNRNSSKGNQLKWFDGDKWYKADFLGYEALAEYLISRLLEKSNVSHFVKYDILPIEYRGNRYIGCCSDNFLHENEELVTLAKLFRQYRGIEITHEYAAMPVEDRIQYVVDGVKEITGLQDFGQYLTMLLEIDAMFLNEDRHMHNIAVIKDRSGRFQYCPVFDNGAALFSDCIVEYHLDTSIEACYERIEAKPFNRSFDVQMDVAEELYGTVFRYQFTIQDVLETLETAKIYYSKQVLHRVEEVMRNQLRRYSC